MRHALIKILVLSSDSVDRPMLLYSVASPSTQHFSLRFSELQDSSKFVSEAVGIEVDEHSEGIANDHWRSPTCVTTHGIPEAMASMNAFGNLSETE
jgi:hypothetical protein